jgi:hypothetical protein
MLRLTEKRMTLPFFPLCKSREGGFLIIIFFSITYKKCVIQNVALNPVLLSDTHYVGWIPENDFRITTYNFPFFR